MNSKFIESNSSDKMKNVIYIVVDAFSYNNLKKCVGEIEITPFLNNLTSKSYCAHNLYSQAPYTEASMVAILSGENTLDNGGYFFGNNNCKSTIFGNFKKNGYKTISGYSPYVYSKAYIRDVDEFYYTRLYSIEPLFMYRLEYFKEKFDNGIISKKEKEICGILLGEAFDTWIKQAFDILNNNKEASLLSVLVQDIDMIKKVQYELKNELDLFLDNRILYVENIFIQWKEHKLIKINTKYNKHRELPLKTYINKAYSNKLSIYQDKYSNIIRKQFCDFNYIIGTLLRNKRGYKDFKGIVHNYMRYYSNKYLSNYLSVITENAKTEVSMATQFEVFLDSILECDKNNQNYFAYIHVQDFHLPSVFHTVDSNNIKQLEEEFNEAFKLLDNMDCNYRGNIIAALSAHYCDCKIRDLFKKLKESLNNNFLFVVTADHGYPSYEDPIRPMVYNQTYTEAFHIPCIIYDSYNQMAESKNNLLSNIDIFKIIQQKAGIKDSTNIGKRNYILSEYGGPGCPDISERPIWYTLIIEDYSISVECLLNDNISYESIVSIYHLKSDSMQKFNKVKKMYNSKKILKFLDIIQERHLELRRRYGNEKFYTELLNAIPESEKHF
ncbi:sulfatase-like hydrolase/transferase [Clostridium tertium]